MAIQSFETTHALTEHQWCEQLFKEHYLLRKTIATLIMLGGAALVIIG